MSILGLPSFETGINLPVFNGVYPKPSKSELSTVDEAVIVSSNGDSNSEATNEQPHEVDAPITQTDEPSSVAPLNSEDAIPAEVGNDIGDKRQLESLDEEPEVEAPVDESTKEITPPQPSESAPAPLPVTDETLLSDPDPVPADSGSPIVNDLVDHSIPGEDVPAIKTTEASQAHIDGADSTEASAEVANETQAEGVEAPSDSADPAAEPPESGFEQAREMPAESLPPISEEPAGSEEQVQNSESSELGADDQTEVVSGPAGLGPLEVIKEEPVVSEEPVTVSHGNMLNETDMQVDKAVTNEVINPGGLEPVPETPEIPETPENAAAREETILDSVNTHEEDAALDEQPADDTTPVDERREYLGVTGAEHPPIDRKDSMFETPFETPGERPSIATEDATPFETSFETPMERPFWVPEAAKAQPASEDLLNDNDNDKEEEKEEEPAEGPFIPRHSPNMEPATSEDANSSWGTIRDAKGVQGMEEENQIAPSVGTASAAESATDVEPLLSDEQLDVDDEFRPGLKTQSIDYTS